VNTGHHYLTDENESPGFLGVERKKSLFFATKNEPNH